MSRRIELGERSRFYQLARDVAARLVGARGPEIDAAVDDCLSWTGEYFGVQTVSLGGISRQGELTPTLRVWGQLPPRDTSLGIDPQPGQEMVARFSRDGSLVYRSLEDLADLPQYREHTRRMGVQAAVFWMHRDLGSHVEGMAIGSPTSRAWPEDIVERLGLLGESLFNALGRRKAEVDAERLWRFERVAADVASRFVHVAPEEVDGEIDRTLEKVCRCVDADHGALVQWNDPENSTLRVTHEWGADSIDGPPFRGALLSEDYPWLAGRLRDAKPLLISTLEDLPPEATIERATCERIGIQSIVWAPFVATHGLQGYVALSTVNRPGLWLEGVVPRLGLVGNVLASAIERQSTNRELARAYAEIRDLRDRLEAENLTLREEVNTTFKDEELIGRSHAFRTTLHQVEQVGRTDSTVLILGETGTGKGLIARRIHELGERSARPLVTVNCAALPATLIESELFGHERGAFTGAVDRKIGRFELANDGTIFLDEVGDLPIELQAKLLRVLQDHEFERLGSSTTRTVDTRVIAATNRDLDGLMARNAFRADLYYRLGVFPIRVPPLRERRGDIPLLVWFCIANQNARLGKRIEGVSAGAMESLISYDWPGNVRELQNVVERAMILSPGTDLELQDALPQRRIIATDIAHGGEQPSESLEDVERAHILSVLEECGWRVRGMGGAAERLGIKRTTLQSRMKKLAIRRPSAPA